MWSFVVVVFLISLFCALRQPGSTNQSGQSCSGLKLFLYTVKGTKSAVSTAEGQKRFFSAYYRKLHRLKLLYFSGAITGKILLFIVR